MNLADVLQRPDVWRAGRVPAACALATGFPPLDALLPGNGWPIGALTEICCARTGIGELRLLLPALAQLSRSDRWIAFIAPPYIPYPPALAAAGVDLSRLLVIYPKTPTDHRWAAETSLRAGACAAVLAWNSVTDGAHIRRLQLAAEAGRSWGVLFQRHTVSNLPVALRLRLEPADRGAALNVHVVKRRGGWPAGPVRLGVHHAMAMPVSAGSSHRGLHPRHTHG